MPIKEGTSVGTSGVFSLKFVLIFRNVFTSSAHFQRVPVACGFMDRYSAFLVTEACSYSLSWKLFARGGKRARCAGGDFAR
jgi:hypothetical protein